MTTKSNFNGMREVMELWNTDYTPGIILEDKINKITDILELNERNTMGLQNLRDFTVMYLSGLTTEARIDGDMELFDKLRDCSSAVSHIIDTIMIG